MAPPVLIGEEVPAAWAERQMEIGPDKGDFQPGDFVPSRTSAGRMVYVAPNGHSVDPIANELNRNQSSVWHYKYDFRYDLGTIFTMIAGLLNLLVVFDAAAGPALGRDWHEHEQRLAAAKAALEAEAAEKKAAKAKRKRVGV
ncbi:MAG: hypothetical protein QM811_29215 [Pirellulales bacterium]